MRLSCRFYAKGRNAILHACAYDRLVGRVPAVNSPGLQRNLMNDGRWCAEKWTETYASRVKAGYIAARLNFRAGLRTC